MSNVNGEDWADKFIPPPPTPDPYAKDPTWFYKYAPTVKAPTAPQTVIPTIKEGVAHMQLEDAILAYNNGLSQFATGASVWTDIPKGVIIHKIDLATAAAISTRVKPSAIQYDLPVTYVLGCLAIESTLDPGCQNGNLGPGESNISNDPLGYDMGIAQLKLRYLVNIAPGVKDATTAHSFALDLNLAIPYHCSLMATKVLWATNIIQQNIKARADTQGALNLANNQLESYKATIDNPADPTPEQVVQSDALQEAIISAQNAYTTACKPDQRLNNPLLLATGAYNFGNTGMMAYYETGQFPSHCQHVINLEQYFANKIGQASVFASIQ